MNPRMKEKGILVKPKNEIQIRNPWIPKTPGDQIHSRSNGISTESWREFLEHLDKDSKQTSSSNRAGDNFNQSSSSCDQRKGNALTGTLAHNSSSYTMSNNRQIGSESFLQVNLQIGDENSGHCLNPQTHASPAMIATTDPVMSPLILPRGMNEMNSPRDPLILNSYSKVDSSWTQGNFTSLLLGDEIPAVHANNTIPHMLNNGFNVPVQNNYNINNSHGDTLVQNNYKFNLDVPPRCGGGNARTSIALAPTTPDHRLAEILKFLVDDSSCQDQYKMENFIISSIGNEAIEHQCSELLQTIAAPLTLSSTPQSENKISGERGVQQVIDLDEISEEERCVQQVDLNETPKQKAPKRQKHRPKVVIEGKPKRTPKPKTSNKVESEENASRKKRKYVRKDKDPKVENLTLQQTEAVNTDNVPNSESWEKSSCRKRLNFEKVDEGERLYTEAKVHTARHQGNQPESELNWNFPANQIPVVESSLAGEESCCPSAQSGKIRSNTSNISEGNLCPMNGENWESLNTTGELSMSNRSPPNFNLDKSREIRWRGTHQMVERDVGNFKGFYAAKEEDSHPIEVVIPTSDRKVSSTTSMCQEPFQFDNEVTKKPRVGKELNDETFKKWKMEPEKLTNDERTVDVDSYKQKILAALKRKMFLERVMREKMANRSTQVKSTVINNSNLQSADIITSKQADKSNGSRQQNENDQKSSMHNDGLNMTANPCRTVSFCTNQVPPLHEHKNNLHQHQQQSMTARGPQKSVKYSTNTVDKITLQLQSLSIKGENGETDGKDIYTLVPYEEGEATMVPYEPKKSSLRPKVDLDPETTRIWNLLMGKEGTEASESKNKDKEKWWEEERRVFRGRADSFIARMHLVQGDRRFSPWKGSVVDSIIGVFLTQNVSDHLSSSAFMALAAQFPLGVATHDETSDHSGTNILTDLESLGSEPKQITKEHASSSKNSSDFSSPTINREIQSPFGSNSEAEDNSSNAGKYIKNYGLKGVQRSPPSQVVENPACDSLCFDDRSMHFYKQSSGSNYNKQIQESDRFLNTLNSFSPLNHRVSSTICGTQNSAIPQKRFQLLRAPQVTRSQLDCCEMSRKECIHFFPSSAPEIIKGKSIGYKENKNAEMMTNAFVEQNGFQNSRKQNIDPFAFLTQHLIVQKSSAPQGPQITHQDKRSHVYGSEQKGYENRSGCGDHDPSILTHRGPSFDIQEGTTAANKKVLLWDRSTDGHAQEHACFPDGTNTETFAKSPNMSIKHEKEKKDTFDWDSLRKTVQSNGRGKERSVNALDSMDYEAIRCADVSVISDSIKIRGMNNVLSKRIKEFLNRVVTDHGSIDLEWLRDVPPDKAKEYLLDIRGLGLKSVECVRLLTLHHLAFPVDTNVGRIAVRLGWVPLQPLPESLQLHLLEMYPMLDSVQKYLWPRLCNLDQKILYELHYQLITFGKVFCTKNKPNCNACPMRGDCRHFASAFASAKLALPAPEEKGIVGSARPIATDRRADVAMKSTLLQTSGINGGENEPTENRCEPIIEEPTTPEPEITETDIEDAFYEDPDEIPTIRLNVKQLALNLSNFMEEHTNLQKGDMSKALVALAPEVASIPVTKLKYVLRLRRERQVYVLTDTHPLVKELDKREPDDPSPYLFALLAPGEEPASGQLSGTCCKSNKPGELCQEKECSSVNGDQNSLTVRGTLLIPCRTAMKGSFPLNGTYFQVNEVFADHESSLKPIDVPRAWLWNLETRTVFFGNSATSIFRGMTTKDIQNSFWRGYVCVRGFDRKTRVPRPLNRNLHIPHSKTVKTNNAT